MGATGRLLAQMANTIYALAAPTAWLAGIGTDRVVALQDIFGDGDPYMSIGIGRDGLCLIERRPPVLKRG